MSQTPRYDLPYIAEGGENAEAAVNASLDFTTALIGLYIEDRDFDPLFKEGVQRWEDSDGIRWRNDRNTLFKAADVLVFADGYLLADQSKTNIHRRSKRRARVVMFYLDGSSHELGEGDCFWPANLAKDGNRLAMTESPGNVLWLGEILICLSALRFVIAT